METTTDFIYGQNIFSTCTKISQYLIHVQEMKMPPCMNNSLANPLRIFYIDMIVTNFSSHFMVISF